MLDWESQRLDLEEGGLTEQTIAGNAQRMCSQFGVETSTQAPKGMGMIDFDIELSGKLRVHRFDHLANSVEKALPIGGHLLLLIAARNRFEFDTGILP